MNSQFFEAVRLERTVMFFLLFFIVVVAAFGINEHAHYGNGAKAAGDWNRESARANIAQIIWVFLGQGNNRWLFGTLTGLGLE